MNAKRTGFTLIELLMVVLVILMLSAILFRVTTLVGDRIMRARAISDIQNLQNALNEYLAEYGTYPPVQTVAYHYENTNAAYQPPVLRRRIANPNLDPMTDSALGYRYGLVSHLWLRRRGTESGHIAYDADTLRDIGAKERWAHYLNNIRLSRGAEARVYAVSNLHQFYSNAVLTIRDPWGRQYQYESPPPHLSYELWSPSIGRDGVSDTDVADDEDEWEEVEGN